MEDHRDYRLTAYLFDNLTPEGRREVEAHLVDCARCRDELAELRATLGLVKTALAPSPDTDLALTQERKAQVVGWPARRRILNRMWGSLAACVVLGFVALAVISGPRWMSKRVSRETASTPALTVKSAASHFNSIEAGPAPTRTHANTDDGTLFLISGGSDERTFTSVDSYKLFDQKLASERLPRSAVTTAPAATTAAATPPPALAVPAAPVLTPPPTPTAPAETPAPSREPAAVREGVVQDKRSGALESNSPAATSAEGEPTLLSSTYAAVAKREAGGAAAGGTVIFMAPKTGHAKHIEGMTLAITSDAQLSLSDVEVVNGAAPAQNGRTSLGARKADSAAETKQRAGEITPDIPLGTMLDSLSNVEVHDLDADGEVTIPAGPGAPQKPVRDLAAKDSWGRQELRRTAGEQVLSRTADAKGKPADVLAKAVEETTARLTAAHGEELARYEDEIAQLKTQLRKVMDAPALDLSRIGGEVVPPGQTPPQFARGDSHFSEEDAPAQRQAEQQGGQEGRGVNKGLGTAGAWYGEAVGETTKELLETAGRFDGDDGIKSFRGGAGGKPPWEKAASGRTSAQKAPPAEQPKPAVTPQTATRAIQHAQDPAAVELEVAEARDAPAKTPTSGQAPANEGKPPTQVERFDFYVGGDLPPDSSPADPGCAVGSAGAEVRIVQFYTSNDSPVAALADTTQPLPAAGLDPTMEGLAFGFATDHSARVPALGKTPKLGVLFGLTDESAAKYGEVEARYKWNEKAPADSNKPTDHAVQGWSYGIQVQGRGGVQRFDANGNAVADFQGIEPAGGRRLNFARGTEVNQTGVAPGGEPALPDVWIMAMQEGDVLAALGYGRASTDTGLRPGQEPVLRAYSYYRTLDAGLDFGSFTAHLVPVPPPAMDGEGLSQEEFRARFGTNPFVDTRVDHFSTFGMDVDTASYTRARDSLRAGKLPDPKSVRVEECVNYFPEAYPADPENAFSVFCEGGPSPFGEGMELLKVAVKARELRENERKNAVLTFAVDVSGSMAAPASGQAQSSTGPTRLALVAHALGTLVDALGPDDRVGIVAYGTHPTLILPHTAVRERGRVLGAIASLAANGQTNLEAGLDLAYRVADEVFDGKALNRVILCSDGVANLGSRGPDEILKKVTVFARRGIYLSSVGFGTGKYNDAMLGQLADKGNGNYRHVDSAEESARVFYQDLPKTLDVLAQDAKIQVEFNPDVVSHYRLLGYEKRDIKDQDFRNDKVDAGEVGPGTTVTVLYEIKRHTNPQGDIGKIFLRYRDVGTGRIEETNYPLSAGVLATGLRDTTDRFRFVAAVAETAELLRDSYFARDGSFERVAALLGANSPEFRARPEWVELNELVGGAWQLNVARLAALASAR